MVVRCDNGKAGEHPEQLPLDSNILPMRHKEITLLNVVVLLASSFLLGATQIIVGASAVLLVEWLEFYPDQREVLTLATSLTMGSLFSICKYQDQ